MRCDLRLRFHHDFLWDPSDVASALAFGLVDIVLLGKHVKGEANYVPLENEIQAGKQSGSEKIFCNEARGCVTG